MNRGASVAGPRRRSALAVVPPDPPPPRRRNSADKTEAGHGHRLGGGRARCQGTSSHLRRRPRGRRQGPACVAKAARSHPASATSPAPRASPRPAPDGIAGVPGAACADPNLPRACARRARWRAPSEIVARGERRHSSRPPARNAASPTPATKKFAARAPSSPLTTGEEHRGVHAGAVDAGAPGEPASGVLITPSGSIQPARPRPKPAQPRTKSERTARPQRPEPQRQRDGPKRLRPNRSASWPRSGQ